MNLSREAREFDRWLTTQPEYPCDECGELDCTDDCTCANCESERALDDDADAYFERAAEEEP